METFDTFSLKHGSIQSIKEQSLMNKTLLWAYTSHMATVTSLTIDKQNRLLNQKGIKH